MISVGTLICCVPGDAGIIIGNDREVHRLLKKLTPLMSLWAYAKLNDRHKASSLGLKSASVPSRSKSWNETYPAGEL